MSPETDSLYARFAAAFNQALPQPAGPWAAPSLPGASAALAAGSLAPRVPARLVLAVASSSVAREELYGDCCALAREMGAQPFCFPQQLEGDAEASGLRLGVIRLLKSWPASPTGSTLIATSVRALLQTVPDPDAAEAASVELKSGSTANLEETAKLLAAGGYERTTDVAAPGQFAIRGGILDVWPPAEELPWRAEFFGDVIESLRSFDPASQRSVKPGASIWVPPCSEKSLKTVHLVDLLPPGAAVLWLEHDRLEAAVFDVAAEDKGRERVLDWPGLLKAFQARRPALELFTGDPPPAAMPTAAFPIASVPGLAELGGGDAHHPELLVQARKRLLDAAEKRAAAGELVIVTADTAGTCELLSREQGPATRLSIRKLSLSGGFILPRLSVISQPDLYATHKLASLHRAAPGEAAGAALRGGRIENAADLEPGDLVVHVDYGIGRFIGSTEIEINGQRSEVFTIEYADGAKLHVPVAHANLLSHYVGVAGHHVKLHRLGGKRWTREKLAAERAVQDLAASLLETQARRAVVPGIAFNPDPPWMREFEASFPYRETPDQEKVLADIKKDMAAPRPMDRLVCGDAGYGKTELAMRAAFIAVMNGRQVAVLVPTTVLAEQHYETFTDRMGPYPVRIEVVSRFHGPADRQRILAEAAAGRIDILIGTHALLSDNVAFKNLGLLVIDEEQRFGVAHKEKLKQLRQIVDVLTLSATPIPRTLYMSMTGARDLSLLQTPPQERLAVETKIVRDTDTSIATAIRQELARNGQVYFLYNRVMTIHLLADRLRRLVPEARLAVAHGQMASNELSAVMRSFESGETNVLLCTTLVENGLDIPRANTIIIYRADRFGIADLYQLRGRVGRSSQKGYAWFLLPEGGYLDAEARERLAALKKHSGLGSGFNLALRDLEIRGSGNLLGAAQSGHIADIGFGLYCQLLRRTVARMKGEMPPLLVDVSLSLDFLDFSPGTIDPDSSACLPYDYIEDEGHRMVIHRRIAEANALPEVKALALELADRYGPPPPAAVRMLKLAEMRIIASERGVTAVETHEGKVYIYRNHLRAPYEPNHRLPILKGRTPDEKLAFLKRLLITATFSDKPQKLEPRRFS